MNPVITTSWYSLYEGCCLSVLPTLGEKSVDLVFGSPPYEAARTYGIDFKLRGQDWVDWMVKVFRESLRVCKGLVAFVVEGQTADFSWSAVPALLMADLHRAGLTLRKPPAFCRVGIPGSGGPDWLRNDWEFVVCATNGGKLPWSSNVAMGHPPKWAPGGAMSYRNAEGRRKNESDGPKAKLRRATRGKKNGDAQSANGYIPPANANPGNLIKCIVGGGNLGGDVYASQNEAPFPEKLAEFFIRSFCPPGGVVLDPFSGSGTTGAVALNCQRKYVGIDIRASQVKLTRTRLESVTPPVLLGV